MKFLSTQSLVSIVLFMEIATLVEGTTDGIGKAANFDVSYLDTDIPDQTIKNDTLGAEQAVNQVSCSLSCLNKRGCVTSLFKIREQICVMMNKFLRTTEKFGRSKVKKPTTKIILLKMEDACSGNPCEKGTKCVPSEFGYKCEKEIEGKSCQDIRQKFPNAKLVDGEYRITNETGGFLFKAYCDMNFDQGGWTQVVKIRGKAFNESSTFADYSTTDNFLATKQFLTEFKKVANFKQFRFECKKARVGTKIHIKTKTSKTDIVDFLVGANNTQPSACGSFEKYPDDDSQLSQKCAIWGYSGRGVWGIGRGQRLADHTMYVDRENHWVLRQKKASRNGRYECDDEHGVSNFDAADFWNVYVR